VVLILFVFGLVAVFARSLYPPALSAEHILHFLAHGLWCTAPVPWGWRSLRLPYLPVRIAGSFTLRLVGLMILFGIRGGIGLIRTNVSRALSWLHRGCHAGLYGRPDLCHAWDM
jgi:hypothetical protein